MTSQQHTTTSSSSIVMEPLCLRQFCDPNHAGTRITYPEEKFQLRINEYFEQQGGQLQDGYAPFCKHLFVPNTFGVAGSIVPITADNECQLRSGYEARRPTELPVLARWFPRDSVPAPTAAWLDIILYSREQIHKERAARGEDSLAQAPWGVVGVKAQDVAHEIPMQPITMLRNALGREEGGSGVPLEREKYAESVAFWSAHAVIK